MPLDALVVAVGYVFVLIVRFNGDPPTRIWNAFQPFLPVAIVVHIAANWLAGLYGHVSRYASITEARRVRLAALGSGVVLFAGSYPTASVMPRSVIVLGAFVVALFLGGVRLFRPIGLTQNETGGAA